MFARLFLLTLINIIHTEIKDTDRFPIDWAETQDIDTPGYLFQHCLPKWTTISIIMTLCYSYTIYWQELNLVVWSQIVSAKPAIKSGSLVREWLLSLSPPLSHTPSPFHSLSLLCLFDVFLKPQECFDLLSAPPRYWKNWQRIKLGSLAVQLCSCQIKSINTCIQTYDDRRGWPLHFTLWLKPWL